MSVDQDTGHGIGATGGARRVAVPAREARGIRVAAGERFRVIDVEGGQVGDLFAFVAADPAEHVSAAHTRAINDRLFPAVGEHFYSTARRPLLSLIRDDSPGHHDMLIPACDPARYAQLGVTGWHASCAQNLASVLASEAAGLSGPAPQPINLFMRIPVLPDGRIRWLESTTAPGDSVTLEALDDLLVVLSACPQDVAVINGGAPTPLAIEVGPSDRNGVRYAHTRP